ncbi:sphingosine 1-phosphate receptor 4 [Bufo gargarizans]|uniref:sphingosine 1-phosphate receptor 4 n=1 Tax=Bufo gargarizans TaxID=30331 RepID=UPI001CF121F8|nr:sphingosine 1-phosphate receptor 4 [Bufo gargarizans]
MNFTYTQISNQCLELVGKQNVNIIFLHYNLTGRLLGRSSENGINLKIISTLIGLFIIMENLTVLVALLRFLRLRRWVHCCLANIAFSDLLAGISYLLNIWLSGEMTFQLSPQQWFLREGLLFTTLAASTFSLFITAVERYCTMVALVSESRSRKVVRAQGLIILCWVLAAIVGSLPLFGWNCLCHIETCSSLLPLYSRQYIVFSLGLLTISLIGIIGFYCTIYYLVCCTARQTAVTTQSRRAIHLLQTVLIILGAFVVCWTPLFIYLLVDSSCTPPSCQSPVGLEWVLALAVLNSAFNPLIYSLRSSEVRKAMVAFLCCACTMAGVKVPACHQQGADITSGSSNESSLRRKSSVRLSRALSFRSPVTSISSVPSQ